MESSRIPWTAASVLLFTFPMLCVSLLRFAKRPSWSRAAFLLAMTLQVTGFGSYAFLLSNQAHHASYLIAYICVALAPFTLAVISFLGFWNLQQDPLLLESNKTHPQERSLQIIGPAIALLQTLALSSLASAFYYLTVLHSPTPILSSQDVILRLDRESRAVACFEFAYTAEYICFFIMACGLSTLSRRRQAISTLQAEKCQEMDHVFRGLYSVTALMIIGSAWKAFGFFCRGSESLDVLSEKDMMLVAPFLLAICILAMGQTSEADKHLEDHDAIKLQDEKVAYI